MITKEQIQNLDSAFKRILVLPITKMTIRELQEAIGKFLEGQAEPSQALFESLLQGKINNVLKKGPTEDLTKLIDHFSPPFRAAVEIAESGEFINMFTSDQFSQGNKPFLVNRVRRVDGEEFHYLSFPETTVRLANVMIRRLKEIKDNIKDFKLDPQINADLEILKKDIDSLLR